MHKKTIVKFATIIFIGVLISIFFLYDIHHVITLESLKSQQAKLEIFYAEHPATTIVIYSLFYILVTACSLPGAAVLTLAGGALFGLMLGTLIVSFASTIGATLAFLAARFLFRESIQARFKYRLQNFNDGITKDGILYLLSLRLIPIFPFFIINIIMGLTPIKTWTFFWVSQVGMLLGTIAYVNAGTQLAELRALSEILSFEIILSFTFLGLVPFLGKAIVKILKNHKQNKPFKKPTQYDYNLVVIGGGAAGLVSAYIASAVKAKVALIEKDKMGGDCLNTGCVPSKALLKSAKVFSDANHLPRYGINEASVTVDFNKVQAHVQKVIKKIAPHDSVERYQSLGVECFQGQAKIISPWCVEFNGKTLTTKKIIIASGASPYVPNINNINQVNYYTSETIWSLNHVPKRLLILGGGPIGCELAQAFARFGAQVTLVEMAPRILAKEDTDVSELMTTILQQEGIKILTNHKAKAFNISESENAKTLVCEHKEDSVEICFDEVMLALGRKANVSDLFAENLELSLNDNGTIQVDDKLRTNYPTIYACGDVVGPYQFTHIASHQAWYACVNALFAPFKQFNIDYRTIPWCTFTDPEIAQVGLNEQAAQENNIAYEVSRYELNDLDRAITDGKERGFIKVLTVPNRDRILGATIVGEHAGDLITQFTLAMKHGIGLNKILSTIHVYPTLAEGIKYTAGVWKKAHAPTGLLTLIEKFHQLQRRKNN